MEDSEEFLSRTLAMDEHNVKVSRQGEGRAGKGREGEGRGGKGREGEGRGFYWH